MERQAASAAAARLTTADAGGDSEDGSSDSNESPGDDGSDDSDFNPYGKQQQQQQAAASSTITAPSPTASASTSRRAAFSAAASMKPPSPVKASNHSKKRRRTNDDVPTTSTPRTRRNGAATASPRRNAAQTNGKRDAEDYNISPEEAAARAALQQLHRGDVAGEAVSGDMMASGSLGVAAALTGKSYRPVYDMPNESGSEGDEEKYLPGQDDFYDEDEVPQQKTPRQLRSAIPPNLTLQLQPSTMPLFPDYTSPTGIPSASTPAIQQVLPRKIPQPNPGRATGEKIYMCEYEGCGQAFKRREHKRRHERSHTSEKPFQCDVESCGRFFSRRDNLNQHKRTHTREGKPMRSTTKGHKKKPKIADSEGSESPYSATMSTFAAVPQQMQMQLMSNGHLPVLPSPGLPSMPHSAMSSLPPMPNMPSQHHAQQNLSAMQNLQAYVPSPLPALPMAGSGVGAASLEEITRAFSAASSLPNSGSNTLESSSTYQKAPLAQLPNYQPPPMPQPSYTQAYQPFSQQYQAAPAYFRQQAPQSTYQPQSTQAFDGSSHAAAAPPFQGFGVPQPVSPGSGKARPPFTLKKRT